MAADGSVTTRITLAPRRDERWSIYLAVAAAVAVVGVFGGQLRTAIVAVPFVVAAGLGGRRPAAAPIATRVSLSSDRCLEHDRVDGLVEIVAPSRFDVELAIDPHDISAVSDPDERPWSWWVPSSVERPVGLPFTVAAHRWGSHQLGPLRLRLTQPGSMFHHEIALADLPVLTVVPREIPRTALFPLATARATSGGHAARRAASDGYDFAEVRGYQPGDRLRDLNWAATLRRGEPHVTRRVPEVAGDLVVLLDGFPDALRRHSEIARDTITWSGRLAWSLANQHLRANDRVGVVLDGAKLRWMAPTAGRRARLDVFELLLAYAASTADADGRDAAPARVHLPPAALVVAVSPLARRHTIERLVRWRTAGHHVDVVAIDVGSALTARAPSLPHEVAGLRRLAFEERVRGLRRHGIGVRIVELPHGDDRG